MKCVNTNNCLCLDCARSSSVGTTISYPSEQREQLELMFPSATSVAISQAMEKTKDINEAIEILLGTQEGRMKHFQFYDI